MSSPRDPEQANGQREADELARWLSGHSPSPGDEFRRRVRRGLESDEASAARVERQVAIYAALGGLLIGLAALGVAGVGPFAAG